MLRTALLLGIALTWFGPATLADGPRDNNPATVRLIPPVGVELTEKQRAQLEAGLAKLGDAIKGLQRKKADAFVAELLPDVLIHHKAVSDALTYNEFLKKNDIAAAAELLEEGLGRAVQLAQGKAPWASQTGLVVRGFISKIDGTVQPYGLVVPESYSAVGNHKHRLDVWLHGRGETSGEVGFINSHRKSAGQFEPEGAFVLHPYGRYSNAFKFAGEVDVLEALADVQQRYRIHANRIAMRGFSMGGAGCWQMGVHFADRWFAVNPGAGFAETREFLRGFQDEELNPTWWEEKLWHWYDCTDWAVNLSQTATVAYSGEIDRQKQAADIMEAAMEREGLDLVHLIGPDTAHKYHPDSKVEVSKRLAQLESFADGALSRHVRFSTYTLRYPSMNWVTVNAMGVHWAEARVEARIINDRVIEAQTSNVNALTFSIPTGQSPFDLSRPVVVEIDGQRFEGPRSKTDRSWQFSLHREGGRWVEGGVAAHGLMKKHGLQGPIDDAFMDSFVFVAPTGKFNQAKVEKWVDSELAHGVEQWRKQFRGVARVVKDDAVDASHIASSNLVLWGDPSSNVILKKIAARLPIQWDREKITVGDRTFDAAHHALVMIYPNPLNPDRYVVINSSFTYREYAYLNNARQVPMLPDWAVIDLRTPPGYVWPGKVVDAGFFDEAWQLKPAGK